MASLETVVPGRYEGHVVDWGIQEVEGLDGSPLQAWIKFEFKDLSGQMQTITWKDFILKRDGARNKKTINCITACGFQVDKDGEVDMMKFLNKEQALDPATKVDITIIDKPSKDGSKVYKQVEWVNSQGQGEYFKSDKSAIAKRLVSEGLGKATKKKVKNHAPKAEDDELDF